MKNLFILAGNGPYDNRGCEAIVRGTAEILSSCFDNIEFLVFSHFINKIQYISQKGNETDSRISHKGLVFAKRPSPQWFYENLVERISQKNFRRMLYKEIFEDIDRSRAVLSVGGDNYSLDYGRPKYFWDLNELVLSKKKPLIIWGASIGPFSDQPEYEKMAIENLRKVIIFARESETVEYLASKGLKNNVYRIADPAFLMQAQEPSKSKLTFKIEDGAIGINLSPLMAKYVTGGDLNKWVSISADIVDRVFAELKRPVYLIPHVTMSGDDDYIFMKNVLSLAKNNNSIILFPATFNAAETKWIISKMHVFVGARMHSIIAALSSAVPALTLSYSIKATGINKDILESLDYCIDKKSIQTSIISKLQKIINNYSVLHKAIFKKNIMLKQKVLESRIVLQNILSKPSI